MKKRSKNFVRGAVEMTAEARDKLNQVCARQGILQRMAVSRLLVWFAELDDESQMLILKPRCGERIDVRAVPAGQAEPAPVSAPRAYALSRIGRT